MQVNNSRNNPSFGIKMRIDTSGKNILNDWASPWGEPERLSQILSQLPEILTKNGEEIFVNVKGATIHLGRPELHLSANGEYARADGIIISETCGRSTISDDSGAEAGSEVIGRFLPTMRLIKARIDAQLENVWDYMVR